ncbi:uncharacterized protein LAESUDRAFT_685536 [Laetiporus sulphureus 93-53]|uniref:Mitochondrial import inner membrane translocase subunit TIM54 n=1 Tax=Laetiporus sulphureus 93-53 TaxID=1314785 RepID=A0A165C712_9APHY|nr:uncharacterized protein LAESUDRAFT_685536 [Laetiporus sulphureus 93-53]KZT02309.1 hypothetical protein LAESUDRAFT_685536 [Laetiporus sulphureus 93-53]
MSSTPSDVAAPPTKTRLAGVKAALKYTGIPPSWLDKRPKLPSRNWLIFIGVTSTLAGAYIYDYRQCRKIRQEYVDKVKYLAQEPLGSLDYPRKVTVYGTKWPGDEDSQRSMRYFRKYVKPILVAAAVDYEMVNGRRYGDLARRIAEEIKKKRRIEVGLDQPPAPPMLLPQASPEEKRRRELEGGIVIVGRPTFKEFMAGLKRGWTDSLDLVDREEQLSRDLESDGRFDEPEPEPEASADIDGEPIPTASRLPPSKPFAAFSPPIMHGLTPTPSSFSPSSSSSGSFIPAELNTPPASIPPQPPIVFVHFINHIGFSQIPHMIWDFFNERHRVREGAQDAYRLIVGQTRPFVAPPPEVLTQVSDADADLDPSTSPAQPHLTEFLPSDLNFDKDAETYYKKSLVRSFASDIAKAREEYYAALPKRLETARALAWGAREPTKDERSYPPPTEVELRAERMKKELRWRADEEGWEIIRPDKEVDWDERFREALKVFVNSLSESENAKAEGEGGENKS